MRGGGRQDVIPVFSSKFRKRDVEQIKPVLPATYHAMEELAGRRISWPPAVEAMTPKEIRECRKVGKGHGLYYPELGVIKINPGMNWLHLYLNFIHENLHHAMPEKPDHEINSKLVPLVCFKAAGLIVTDYDGNSANVYGY